MKKKLGALILVLASIVLSAACASTGSRSAPEAGGGEAVAAPNPPAKPAGVPEQPQSDWSGYR